MSLRSRSCTRGTNKSRVVKLVWGMITLLLPDGGSHFLIAGVRGKGEFPDLPATCPTVGKKHNINNNQDETQQCRKNSTLWFQREIAVCLIIHFDFAPLVIIITGSLGILFLWRFFTDIQELSYPSRTVKSDSEVKRKRCLFIIHTVYIVI